LSSFRRIPAATAAAALAEEAAGDCAGLQASEADAQATLDDLTARADALRQEAAAGPAASPRPSPDPLAVLEADIADAQAALESLSGRVAALKEQADHAQAASDAAQTALAQAQAGEQAALEGLLAANTAFDGAAARVSGLQLGRDELESTTQQAQSDRVKAKAALEGAQSLLVNAQDALAAAQDAHDTAAAALALALAEETEAAKAYAQLSAKWDAYHLIPGALAQDENGLPRVAMDLLAMAETAPEGTAVYHDGTSLYLVSGGEAYFIVETHQGGSTDGQYDLTEDNAGKLCVRYRDAAGKTHLQPVKQGAPVLFTGTYLEITFSSKLRGTTQYLGLGADVPGVLMNAATAVVDCSWSLKEGYAGTPLRHGVD